MKRGKLILAIVVSATMLASCNKEDQAPNVEYLEMTPTTHNGEDYMMGSFSSDINRIQIVDGNGTLHIGKDRQSRILVPGYWIFQNGYNKVRVENNTLIIDETFSDSYIYISSLDGIEVVDGNSQSYIENELAEGSMDINIGGNSTIAFGTEEMNNLAEPTGTLFLPANGFDYNVRISQNGTLAAYNLVADHVDADVLSNGSVYTRASSTLNVDIPSNGTVYYKGFPSITSSIGFQGELIDEN